MSAPAQIREPELLISRDYDAKLLAAFYLQLDAQGLLPVIWSQGVPPLEEFLAWHRDPKHVWISCYLRPTWDVTKLVGFGWLETILNTGATLKAECSIAFLKEHQRHGLPEQFATRMLNYVFDDLVMGERHIDVLYATSPKPNRAAIRFVQRLGFDYVGELPLFCTYAGKPSSSVLSALTRERWQERRKEK